MAWGFHQENTKIYEQHTDGIRPVQHCNNCRKGFDDVNVLAHRPSRKDTRGLR